MRATVSTGLLHFEVYGEKGLLVYDCTDKHSLKFTDAKTKETEDLIPPEEFNAIQSKSFIDLTLGVEDEYTAKIEHGLKCQAVIDAALKSTEENRPVTIKEITDI